MQNETNILLILGQFNKITYCFGRLLLCYKWCRDEEKLLWAFGIFQTLSFPWAIFHHLWSRGE